jgi:hypothetical protein
MTHFWHHTAHLWNHVLLIGRTHHVNPYIFGTLYLAHHPLFWGTFALVLNRVRLHRPYKALATLDVFFWFMPYLYVVVFGRGLPWWVYVLVGLAAMFGAFHGVQEIRKRLRNM